MPPRASDVTGGAHRPLTDMARDKRLVISGVDPPVRSVPIRSAWRVIDDEGGRVSELAFVSL
jgi:hypothetical protein